MVKKMEINRKLLIKMLKIARKKQEEVNDLKDEIFDEISKIIAEATGDNFDFIDLRDVPTEESAWADNLYDEINALVDYGEGRPETICDYLERFLENESTVYKE